MADVIKSIGTDSRDYSTIAAWEADLDDTGIYSSGDVAIGECYNDSAFSAGAFINGGGTVGLSSIILRAADGQQHDGTLATGARIVANAAFDYIIHVNRSNVTVSSIEVNGNGNGNQGSGCIQQGTGAGTGLTQTYERLIGRQGSNHNRFKCGIDLGTRGGIVQRCIVYDVVTTNNSGLGTTVGIRGAANTFQFFNNTVHNTAVSSDTASHFPRGFEGAPNAARNNIAVDSHGTNGTDFGFSGSASITNNLSSDATAPGSDSLTNKSASNQFVSIVGGSEDLHLKEGADAIDAGFDIGTSPTGVNIDIDGRDVDAEGDTWDIGADEFVSATPPTAFMTRIYVWS